ncbi:hypothetical protein F2Q69_00041343 [Brassica cretica]|uniref:Uncharacterized protein n=1 Tax=Brassica cretica TaxID=69181 RepID=A0A8S9NPC8_BRACR|nr:hypothetical protein F2Q69_00041343 [Brassica cretica]
MPKMTPIQVYVSKIALKAQNHKTRRSSSLSRGDGFSDRSRSSLPSSSPLLQRRSSSASRRHHLRRHSAPLLRLLGSESIISSVIISTSPASASCILGESASSSPPSLRSVAAVIRGIHRKGIKGNAAKIHFGCKGIRLFRCIKTARVGDFALQVSVVGTSLTMSKDAFQWEFHVDLNRNASFISIKEDLQFEDLMKIVSEDFKEEVIGLSYGMSLDIKSTVEGFPPISIANTRHLKSFIGKSRSFDGTCRLCVKVNADSPSCNNQDSDTFAFACFYCPERNTASCNRQTSDTFASHVPLNATPVFRSTVQREKQEIFVSLTRRRLLGSESIISSVIISTSPASFILGESATSSPPSLSSVAAASRIRKIFVSLTRRRLLGSESIISSVIISTSPASFILSESASSSPPSLSSVAAASRIGVDHFFRHHLHFSSVGVVHPRRVGVIISAVTQIRFCGNQRNPTPSAVKHYGSSLRLWTMEVKRCIPVIVSEDFKEEVMGLSYGMSLDIKSTVEGFPPISIANTRHLRSFIGKSSSFDGTCRLCVKVNADSPSCNNQDSDTFASPISTVQREIHVDTDPAICNRQTSDTFASHVPLNATPVFHSTLELEISLTLAAKESFQSLWEFHVDLNRNASFISIEEDLQFEDLMKIVSEDFKEEVIGLSYGMSLDIKSTVEGFPPISVANTRHLRSFIGKSRSFDGTCRLCVKVNADSASCNNQASDTFASPVSTVQREIQVDTDPASCNRQTSDTFASHVPLNATPVFRSTVQREKQDRLPNQELILPEHLDFAVSSL